MVGPEKPWRLPDTPGTMGQFHWILYSFFWWPEAKRLPAFREELDAISQGLAPLLQRHIRGQQWKLFFSRGHIFRKRRDKIRWLKNCCPFLTAENRNRLPPSPGNMGSLRRRPENRRTPEAVPGGPSNARDERL